MYFRPHFLYICTVTKPIKVMNQYLRHYTKSELRDMATIKQSWDGSELKVDELGIRVWLNPTENAPHDGDYTIETLDPISGKWESENYYFNR